jgi:peptidyl-prolyl cis-trans isomerase D
MLRFMRKYATGYLIKVLFGIIILAFMISGYFGLREKGKTLAEVGSHKITQAEYAENYDRLLKMYKNIFKEKMDENMVKALKLREAAMSDLVDRYLLLQKAKEAGITVSDEEFRAVLDGVDAFKKDGKFNKKVYLNVLKANNMEPGRFEESERLGMIGTKMMNLIKDNGAVMNDARVYGAYVKEKGKIDLAYMVFDPADYGRKVEVSDKEVEAQYEKEKGSHIGESRYALKYVTVEQGGPVRDDAVYMELLKAKDIDKYGREKGLTVTDLGPMKESEVAARLKTLKPEEWLKGLKKGDISLPVRVGARSYIFQMVDFEAGKPIDKATVMREIRERMIRDKAASAAKAEAETVIGKKSFSSKKETGFLARGAMVLPGIGPLPKEGISIMTLSKGHELYEKPVLIGGKYYIFSLKEEQPPGQDEWQKDREAFKRYVVKKNEDEFFRSFMDQLRAQNKVKIDWKAIAVDSSE